MCRLRPGPLPRQQNDNGKDERSSHSRGKGEQQLRFRGRRGQQGATPFRRNLTTPRTTTTAAARHRCGAISCPCPSTRGSNSSSYLATTPCPRARQPCTSHAPCTRTTRATPVPRSTGHNLWRTQPGRGSAATLRSLPLAMLPLSQACPLYKEAETDIVEDTLCL
jgi:hypothetical protein